MSLRILVGESEGDSANRAVLYCSTTEAALPWMFEGAEDAEAFLEAHGDIRRRTDEEQAKLYGEWVRARSARRELEAARTPPKRRIVR